MKRKILTILSAIVIFFFFLFAIGVSGLYILLKGPSIKLTELVVVSLKENSIGGEIVDVFLPEEEISLILEKNTVMEFTETTEAEIMLEKNTLDTDEITIEEVAGLTYKGYIMIINDPSRVVVETARNNCLKCTNPTEEIIEARGGIAGINGGGFNDSAGSDFGTPGGHVIKDGKVVGFNLTKGKSLVGFDKNNKLVVGYFTSAQAIRRGIRDALTFGPILISNGKPSRILGNSGGINPRTVIGQKKDGTVLMLVIDGRQPNSLGASLSDCIEIMMEYGAINAYNLDGGSSTTMFYDGNIINHPSNLRGARNVPTIFMVE